MRVNLRTPKRLIRVEEPRHSKYSHTIIIRSNGVPKARMEKDLSVCFGKVPIQHFFLKIVGEAL